LGNFTTYLIANSLCYRQEFIELRYNLAKLLKLGTMNKDSVSFFLRHRVLEGPMITGWWQSFYRYVERCSHFVSRRTIPSMYDGW